MSDDKPPKTIYLQWEDHDDYDGASWCEDRLSDEDIEYVQATELATLRAQVAHGRHSVVELADRVAAFAGQLQAWGHEAAAKELIMEILGGEVNAPDYYALRARLAEAEEALKGSMQSRSFGQARAYFAKWHG
jgi:hypothetical protein